MELILRLRKRIVFVPVTLEYDPDKHGVQVALLRGPAQTHLL